MCDRRGRPEEAAEDRPRQVPPSVSRVDLHHVKSLHLSHVSTFIDHAMLTGARVRLSMLTPSTAVVKAERRSMTNQAFKKLNGKIPWGWDSGGEGGLQCSIDVTSREYRPLIFVKAERLSMTNHSVSFQNSTTKEYQGVKNPALSMSARPHVVIASDSKTEIRINNSDLVFQLLQGAP